MRNYVSAFVCGVVALTGLAAFAAGEPFQTLKVHLPETVHVAQSELPAGDYTVRYISLGSDVPYLSFQSEKGQPVVVAAMRNPLTRGEMAEKSSLTFDKSAGELMLSSVQVEGLTYSFEILGRHVHSLVTH